MIYDDLIVGGISGAAAGNELAAGAQVAVREGETGVGHHNTGARHGHACVGRHRAASILLIAAANIAPAIIKSA